MQQTIAPGSDDERGIVQSILRMGTRRFGMPPIRIRDALTNIADVDRLKLLLDRVCEIKSWDELLAE